MSSFVFFYLLFIEYIYGRIHPTGNPSTLVVVSDDFSKYTYSRFFKSLKRRGHKLEIKSSTDKNLKLTEFGESRYNNLIILSPSSSSLGELSYRDILIFIDNGNNLFIGIDNTYTSDFIKKIADRCGIDIHAKSSYVYDHVNYDILRSAKSNNLDNNIILVNNLPKYKSLNIQKINPILYNGIGMSLKKNSHLTLSLLTGNIQTYSSLSSNKNEGPIDKQIISSGNQLSLIAALQMRSDARITFVGSLKMLSDEYFVSPVESSFDGVTYPKSGNEEFMSIISAWSFGEIGILRAVNTTHHQQTDNPTINPTRYRIKDLVTFSTTIQEYKLECNCWVPFNADDIQFEFIRLDSFVRQFIKHDNKGNYKIDFMLPDIFGVYKFTINYKRRGWSYLFVEELVDVRPFRHDEYQRFLQAAYPYYLGSASMIVGFIIFTFVFLFGHVGAKKRKIW